MAAGSDPQLYFHVRVVMGMILGLCITRLLSGFAKFIQHPRAHKASILHLGWAANLLISAILFWWWEYRLAALPQWTFFIYFFVLTYTSLFYFMCVLLFPDDLGEYHSYDSYFFAKRRWFFGLQALSHVMDVGDTLLKGGDYLQLVGAFQLAETAILVTGCLVAMKVRNRAFHGAFLILTAVDQFFWIGWLLNTLS